MKINKRLIDKFVTYEGYVHLFNYKFYNKHLIIEYKKL